MNTQQRGARDTGLQEGGWLVSCQRSRASSLSLYITVAEGMFVIPDAGWEHGVCYLKALPKS